MAEAKGGLDLSALKAGAKKLREVEQPAQSKAEVQPPVIRPSHCIACFTKFA